jgi:hypothetical protein
VRRLPTQFSMTQRYIDAIAAGSTALSKMLRASAR